VIGRILQGGDYPGLAELIGDFYVAVARGGPSPLAPDHLQRVTAIDEELAANVRGAAERAAVQRVTPNEPAAGAPLAAVTGARGFFGKEITRELARRGFRVRGITRSPDPEDPHVHEWRPLGRRRPVPRDAFGGATVVGRAAVDAAGGHAGHPRHRDDAAPHEARGVG